MLTPTMLMAAAGAAGAGGVWNPGLLTDLNCVALYNMLSGALITDSKGGNTLTNNNGVTECTALKENLGCAAFDTTVPQFFYRNDADLDSGFPMKNGESNLSFSVCFWMNLTSFVGGYTAIIGKGAGFISIQNTGRLRIFLSGGSVGAGDFQEISLGKLYHIGVTFDGNNGPNFAYRFRVWDDEAGVNLTDYAGTTTYPSVASAYWFLIGDTQWSSSEFDGQMAEVAIFNDILTPDEIDQIRQGIYGI